MYMFEVYRILGGGVYNVGWSVCALRDMSRSRRGFRLRFTSLLPSFLGVLSLSLYFSLHDGELMSVYPWVGRVCSAYPAQPWLHLRRAVNLSLVSECSCVYMSVSFVGNLAHH